MEKRYTVKSSGKTAEGKHIWEVYDKEQAVFLSQFEGGKFQLQDIAKKLNEGSLSTEPKAGETVKTVGYMRISTTNDKQSFDRQQMQLEAMGCSKIYQDRVSGSKRDREQLNLMLEELEAGDTVLIVAIDRLSRSTKDLLEIVEIIKSKGAFLKSINDSWLDTTQDNPMSDFLLTVMGALGQMERAMITQRVKEGVATARAKGKKLGRPTANKSKVELALELYYADKHTSKEICEITGISKATLFRKVKQAEESATEQQ